MAKNHSHTDGHGNSMTEWARWGRFTENENLPSGFFDSSNEVPGRTDYNATKDQLFLMNRC